MRIIGHRAFVASLASDGRDSLRLWVALGSPCASVYVPCSFDELPSELAQEPWWHRLAALADRSGHRRG